MKNKIIQLMSFLLVFYSLALIIIELIKSQSYVRNFFTDIKDPIGNFPFYGINTSICFFLLWAAALMFLIVIIKNDSKILNPFYFSQVFIFFYLGLDERLLIHEYLGDVFRINDAIVLLIIGILELFFLIYLGKIFQMKKIISSKIFFAGVFFLIMVIIDGFFPSAMVLRLSFEDIFKTWAIFFIFLFSLNILLEFDK